MPAAEVLLAKLTSFLIPGGDAAAHSVRAIRTRQTGEMFASADAKPTTFTAVESVDVTNTAFRWEARFSKGLRVTDAYENGHGLLQVTLGGLLPLKKMAGEEFDRGELQRYLAYAMGLCPPILLNNPSLVWNETGANVLRVSDRADNTGATVDIEIGPDGSPVECRAMRPRLEGSRCLITPWSAVNTDFVEQEGIRFATKLESRWHMAEGTFTAVKIHVASIEILWT